jgi:long-chain acyl-CoA synthetase
MLAERIDIASYGSIGELLEDALVQFKSETALIEVDREKETKRLTYLDVKRAAAPVIRLLEARGIGPDDRVAILMSNQSRWLIAAYAIFHRGAVLVPLDYKLSAPEQLALLDHCRPKALIGEAPILKRLEIHRVPLVLSSEAPPDAAALRWEDLEHGPVPPRVARTREDLATIVYSSGTGGRAKGCMLTHDAYLEQLRGLMDLFPMRPSHRVFSILPTNHAIDFMVGFLGPFACGASVVHQRTLRPEFLKSTMRRYEITHMALVPLVLSAFEEGIQSQIDAQPKWTRRAVSMLSGLNELLTDRKPQPDLSRKLLSPIHDAFGGKLELLFCGGAFVDRQRAELFYRLGLPVVIGYGLTETCTVATVNDLRPFRADSVGRALSGIEVAIADAGPDGVGEVRIRGRTLMKGYLDDPELTASTITEDGWLKTGDLGWIDAAHHLHLVGRAKNMIVTAGGKNIYPEDVEGAFEDIDAEELAIVASGYIWPRRAKLEEERLLAIVRPHKGNGVAPSPARVLEALSLKNRRLPDHKRVHGVIFWSEPFPRTASMKVKRDALAQMLREGAQENEIVAL